MPLSLKMRQVNLTLECMHCGHPITKTGRWFISAHRFKCDGCSREVPLGYSEKIALFKKHAHLTQPSRA